MKPQTITLQTDDGQTLTLKVASAVIGEPEAETLEEETAEAGIEDAGVPLVGTKTPIEKLKERRAAKGY